MIKHPNKPLAVHTWDWKEFPCWESISNVTTEFHELYGHSKITYVETGSDEHAIVIHSIYCSEEEVKMAYGQHYEWEEGIDQDAFDWAHAKYHLNDIRSQYTAIGVSGLAALNMTINPLLVRLESGERTKALYDDIIQLQ